MRTTGSTGWIATLLIGFGLQLGWLGCSDSTSERGQTNPPTRAERAAASERTEADATVVRITKENALAHEEVWPDIVAVVDAWTPPESSEALKKGYRGALIRLDERGRVRIAFGRHGNHDIPIEHTDFLERANAILAGERFKPGPTFLVHFGNQFLHPSTAETTPYPSAELAKHDLFLCVFASPSEADFESIMRELASLQDVRRLQILFFPLATKRSELDAVQERLRSVGLPVPFAYPEAAEVHARSLLGEVPDRPMALLITAEGRSLGRTPLDVPAAAEVLRGMLDRPDAPTPQARSLP
ncbi:MAG: hypothetical protein R3F35_07755 [Myxococcota bacterium]